MKITFPGAYVKNFSWLASFRRSHPTRLPSLAASLRAETPRSSINKYRHDHFLDASHPGGENTLTRLGRRSVRTSHRGGENRSPPPALPKVRPARIPRHSHSPPPLRREILVELAFGDLDTSIAWGKWQSRFKRSSRTTSRHSLDVTDSRLTWRAPPGA